VRPRAPTQRRWATASICSATDSTRGHYNLGTVYEEYGRNYANLGRMTQALDYLERARQALPATPYWESLLATARALALVKGGELRAGVELAVAAAEQCRRTGHVRHLDRIYMIQQYLDQLTRDIALLNAPLREALAGGRVTDY
jgi:tetratricopeptide (TPR) repeat protein